MGATSTKRGSSYLLLLTASLSLGLASACGSGEGSRRAKGDEDATAVEAGAGGSPSEAAPPDGAPPPPDADADADARIAPDAPPDAPAPAEGALSVTLTGSGTGTLTSDPAGIACGDTCTASFPAGTTVTLTATPADGSVFTGFTGPCAGDGGTTCTVTVDGTTTVEVGAGFDAPNPTLDVSLSGSGAGRVVADTGGLECPTDCVAEYERDAAVTLTAIPDATSDFTGWTGACAGTEAVCTVTLAESATVGAGFTLKQQPLTLTTGGDGDGTLTVTTPDVPCDGECSFDHGAQVTLTAAPEAGSFFLGWSGDSCSGTDPTCTVTMDQPRAVEAIFSHQQFGVVVRRTGTGRGSVRSDPTGIACAPTCTAAFSFGESVVLTARAAVGSTFAGFTGCDATTATTCTVDIDGARDVSARFDVNRYDLTVVKNGTGTGVVSADTGGIACGGTCADTYDHGTNVVLTAVPGQSSTFAGWTNCPAVQGSTCTVAMTAARTVTATFSIRRFTLTAAKAGGGDGTITSAPAGVACGADCSQVYDSGTTVRLTAAEDAFSTFAGWAGCDTVAGAACTVNVTAARTVTATFRLRTFTLTAALAGNGSGVVSSDIPGISCGRDCSQAYTAGTDVVLTARPSVGSRFMSWTNCPAPSGAACTVDVTAARTVTATFTLNRYTLTVAKAGRGTGTVTSAPAGITCGADCAQAYDYGTDVVLTAAPDPRMHFTGWTNCPSPSGATCAVDVTAASTVTATFDPNRAPVVTITAPADGSIFPENNFDSTLGLYYTDVTFTGTATDPEDGALRGAALRWTTDQTQLQPALLGTGTTITVRIYTPCNAATHRITLRATDSDGLSGSASIVITFFSC